MAAVAKCRNPVLRKDPRKQRGRLEENLMGRPVKTEEWMEKVSAHCERCHDDKDETSQMQEDRIQQQRRRGDGLEAWIGR